jgi:hypothetical protein
MEENVLALRPMTVSDIVDASIRIYRRNFAPLLGIAAVVQVPMMAVQIAAQYMLMRTMLQAEGQQFPAEQMFGAIGMFGLMILVMLLLAPIGQAALAVGISELYLGRGITIRRAYEVALKYWPRVLGTSILMWLFIYVCSLAGLIGLFVGSPIVALWLVVRYLVAPDVIVVLENRWGTDAMRRSWQLTGGYYWTIFAIMAILYLMIIVAAYGLTLPLAFLISGGIRGSAQAMTGQALTAQMIYQAVAATVMVIMRPIPMIGAVLVYYDLRIRKEGFDLVMMAEALGQPAPQGYGPAPQQPLYGYEQPAQPEAPYWPAPEAPQPEASGEPQPPAPPPLPPPPPLAPPAPPDT